MTAMLALGFLLAQDEKQKRVEEAVVALLEKAKVPGASVSLVEGGKLLWAKGYGVREAGIGEAVDVETLFQAASISKPVAAMAALASISCCRRGGGRCGRRRSPWRRGPGRGRRPFCRSGPSAPR